MMNWSFGNSLFLCLMMRNLLLLFSSILLATTSASCQTNTNDTLHWNENRPISFADFKGESMEFTGFIGENFCMLSANYYRPNTFARTDYIVEAIWDRNKSWIAESAKNEEVLRFFQVSFDIYELHARSLRKKCLELPRNSDPTKLLQPMYNEAMTSLMEEYNLFRKDTKMGQDTDAVIAWKDAINVKLQELQDYR